MNLIKLMLVYVKAILRGLYSSILFSSIKYAKFCLLGNQEKLQILYTKQNKLNIDGYMKYIKRIEDANNKMDAYNKKCLEREKRINDMIDEIDSFFEEGDDIV